MKKHRIPLILVALLACTLSAYALYSVADEGRWPESWPKELEPLRKQSTTLIGPMFEQRHYHIPFKDRAAFEAAWPHLLKVKSPGAPVILVRSPYQWVGHIDAGVIIHTPPAPKQPREEPPVVQPSKHTDNPRSAWMNANYIELIVDSEIVDLNRIELPADGRIIDERFKKMFYHRDGDKK